MDQFQWKNRKRTEAETAPLDPIALSLALWLGLVVGITGLIRLSDAAAENAMRAQQEPQRAMWMTNRPKMAVFAPYGS